MKTKELQILWWDWLSTSERLLHSLHEQTAALTLRDVQRVERLQPELEKLLAKMKEIDDRAVACAKGLAEELGAEPSLRGLVRVLDKAEAQQVQAMANRVTIAARNVEAVLSKNQRLIENEMHYIHGTMTLVAKAASDSQQSYARSKAKRGSAAVLLDEAA